MTKTFQQTTSKTTENIAKIPKEFQQKAQKILTEDFQQGNPKKTWQKSLQKSPKFRQGISQQYPRNFDKKFITEPLGKKAQNFDKDFWQKITRIWTKISEKPSLKIFLKSSWKNLTKPSQENSTKTSKKFYRYFHTNWINPFTTAGLLTVLTKNKKTKRWKDNITQHRRLNQSKHTWIYLFELTQWRTSRNKPWQNKSQNNMHWWRPHGRNVCTHITLFHNDCIMSECHCL